MSRSLWFAAGAGAGVYTMVRLRRAAEILTPDGLADRLGALRLGARLVREEVAQGRAEVQDDLRRRLAAPPAAPGGPSAAGAPEALAPAAPPLELPEPAPRTTRQEGTP